MSFKNINSVNVVLKEVLFCWTNIRYLYKACTSSMYSIRNKQLKTNVKQTRCSHILKVIFWDLIWCWYLTVDKPLSKLDYLFEKFAFFTIYLSIIFLNAWNKWCLIKKFWHTLSTDFVYNMYIGLLNTEALLIS